MKWKIVGYNHEVYFVKRKGWVFWKNQALTPSFGLTDAPTAGKFLTISDAVRAVKASDSNPRLEYVWK